MTAPGILRLVPGTPNPAGGIDQLFLMCGDAVSGPVERVEGVDQLPGPAGRRTLRIFHFNDLHNHLTELSGPDAGTHRLSRMVELVRRARRDADDDEAVLFLSIGDDHTGSVLDELVGRRAEQFVLDAGYRACSAAGVDFSVLGNHEFDRGSALLAMGIRQDARFPILSANVHSSRHLVPGQDYFPAAIAVCKGLRIGLIGLTTHIETRVGQPGDPALAVASPIATLGNLLPVLAPLVDVVLLLSHCGFGDGEHQSGKAAASRDIGEADFSIARVAAAMTDKPILVIGAHTHTKLNETGLEAANTFDGVPVLQAECNGRYLGEVDMLVDAGDPGKIRFANVCLHPIRQHDDYDRDFEKAHIAPLTERVQDFLTNTIATVETDLLSFKTAALARYAHESALLNFIADAIFGRMESAGYEVDFALVNAATIQAGIEPGALSMAAWFDVIPYADEVCIVSLTGRELEHLVHSNAKRVLRPEEIAATDYTGFLSRGFLHSSKQLRYRLELGAAARDARAGAIKVCGQALNTLHECRFNVVMSTYLAFGAFGERWNGRPISGGVPGGLEGYDLRPLPNTNTGLVYRNEVAAFIERLGRFDEKTTAFCDGRLALVGNEEVVS